MTPFEQEIALQRESVNQPQIVQIGSSRFYNQCRDAIASGNPVEAAKQVNGCIDFLTAEQMAKLQLMLSLKVWEANV